MTDHAAARRVFEGTFAQAFGEGEARRVAAALDLAVERSGDALRASGEPAWMHDIRVAEEFAFRQQGNSKITTVSALTQYFDLSFSDNEELVAVFTFNNQFVTKRYDLGLKSIDDPRRDIHGQTRKQRNAAESLRRNGGNAADRIDINPFGFREFDLRPIHTIGTTGDLYPRQQP